MQTLTIIHNVLNTVTNGSILGKVGIYFSALLAAFFTPIVGLLLTCFIFTILDLIYGLKVAKRFKQKITSEKTWKGTITKVRDEWLIIVLARMLEFTVLGSTGIFVFTGGATVIIGLTELWSILENLNTLNPKGPWRALGKFLKKKGEDYTGINIEDNNDNNGTNSPSVDKQPS